uniref:F-box domain-containing protein n=1 Tax=Glossina brevipalpis TaxID=37001 RepID=A0A1A9WJ75_9MUSC
MSNSENKNLCKASDGDRRRNPGYGLVIKKRKKESIQLEAVESNDLMNNLPGSSVRCGDNALIPELPNEELDATSVSNLMQVDLTKFSKLKSLLMPSLGNFELKSILTQMRGIRLEKLRIDAYSVDSLNVLETQAPSLRYLHVYLGNYFETTLAHRLQEIFKKFVQLEELDIKIGGREYMRVVLENLPKENRLKSIALDISEHDDHELLQLLLRKWSSSLECIDLKCDIRQDNVKRLNLANEKIRSLDVSVDAVNSQDLLYCIASKANITLTKLSLEACPKGTLFGDLVQRLPHLTSLELSTHGLTDDEMEYIFHYLINLRHLHLAPCIDLSCIKYLPSKANISNLKRLQSLESCWCPFKMLHISSPNFEFKELNCLNLASCRRTPVLPTVVHFKNYFPALEKLSVERYYTPSTDAREMRKSFPRLRRYHNSRCMVFFV